MPPRSFSGPFSLTPDLPPAFRQSASGWPSSSNGWLVRLHHRSRSLRPTLSAGGLIPQKDTKGKDRTLVAAENVSRDVMAQLETSLDKPGIHVAAVQRRHYPNGTTAAHAIGYLNEVSAEELKTRKDEGYQAGDTIGRTGIERQWEPYLRGQKGFEKVVVNRRGLRRTDVHISDLVTDGPVSQSPSPGNNVILTLDLDVQRIVERALRSVRSAAAVVVDIETGRILAIASKPAFDPNMMSGGLSPENIAR